jgi:hypothetical protein
MLHPNHWFVANNQGPELRVSRWDRRSRLRPGAKHLCGQTCLHKLVDEFTARAVNPGVPADGSTGKERRKEVSLAPPKALPVPALPVIAAAYIDEEDQFESSARLTTLLEPPRRGGRAEAWKRERERQQEPADLRNGRRSIA